VRRTGFFAQLAKISHRSRFYECMDIFVHQGWTAVRSIQQLKGKAMRNLFGCLSLVLPKLTPHAGETRAVVNCSNGGQSVAWAGMCLAAICAGVVLWLFALTASAKIVDSGPIAIAMPAPSGDFQYSEGLYVDLVNGRVVGARNDAPDWVIRVFVFDAELTFQSSAPDGQARILGAARSTSVAKSHELGSTISVNGPNLIARNLATSDDFRGTTGKQYLGFRFLDSSNTFRIGYLELQTTAGTGYPLVLTRYVYEDTLPSITITAGPSITDTLTTSEPTYVRPGLSSGSCDATTGFNSHYRAYTFKLDTVQNVNISGLPGEGGAIDPANADTVMLLYGPGGFNPSTPCANVVAFSDDAAGTRQSKIATTSPVAAGIYTLVVSNFANVSQIPNPAWTYKLVANVNLIRPVINGLLNFNNSLFNRPEGFLQGQACSASSRRVHYRTHRFTLAAPQSVTISALAEEGAIIKGAPDADTFLVLYGPGGFNPTTPCNNAIIANDDVDGPGRRSRISTDPLQPGNYTLVFTSFRNTPFGPTSLPWPYTLAANVALQGSPTDQTPALDLSADGKSDILYRDGNGGVGAVLMNGAGGVSAGSILAAGAGWSVTHTADFDGDGKADLLIRNTDGRIAVLLMNGTNVASFSQLVGAGTGYTAVVTGDFNADGKADIVVKNVDGSSAILLMDGGTIGNAGSLLTPGSPYNVTHVGDFDGDGRSDLIIRNTDGSAAILLMNGAVVRTASLLLTAAGPWSVNHVAELSGDGKADVIIRNTDGSTAILIMDGSTVTSAGFLLTAGSPYTVSHTGDFDGNGGADIVLKHVDGSVVILLMRGTAVTSAATLLLPGSTSTVSQVADYNGDGQSDILLRNADGSATAVLMNGTTVTAAGNVWGAGTLTAVP
jgi:FG-GAP-like repeat